VIERFLLWLAGHRCPTQAPPAIRFNRATLCLDCNWITESQNDHCDRCSAAGGSLLRLGGVLDGRGRVR
jgi:hypothetical protein